MSTLNALKLSTATFADSPCHTTSKSGCNSGFCRVLRQEDRNHCGIELAPVIGQQRTEITLEVIVDSYESPCKASGCVNMLLTQNHTEIAFHTKRVLPVSSSCIMPCFRAAVLFRRCSSPTNSLSISISAEAIAICSLTVGGS